MAMNESLASDVLEPSKCGPCLEDNKDNEAVMFCVECNDMLCDSCVGIHKRFSTMKTHKIVVQSDKKRFEFMAEIMSDKCKQHHGKHLETYCQDHAELCCSVCVSLNHRLSLGIVYLPDYVKEDKSKKVSTEAFESLKGLTGKFNELISTLANAKKALKLDKSQILKTLDEERDQLFAEINRVHASVRQEIVSYHDAAEVEIDNNKATCDSESKTLSSVIDSLEVWKNDQVRTYIGMYRVNDMTNESKKKLETVKRYADRGKVMNKEENRLKNRLRESDVSICSNTPRQSQRRATNFDKGPNYSLTFGKKICEQQFGNNSIQSIATLENGRLVAADFQNNILIIDENLKLVEKIPVQYAPRFVCMMTNNEVCISFQHQHEIHIATLNGGTLETKRVIKIGKQCRGVCFKTDKIYVACGQGPDAGLRVYSKEGEFIKEYNNDRNGQKLFSAPYAVTTSSDSSMMFVADRNKGVIALSADGTSTWTIVNDVLKDCWSIVLDDIGSVYTCGFSSNNIVKISRDGKLVREVLKGIINPGDICFDGENERFIVVYNTNIISVYGMITQIE